MIRDLFTDKPEDWEANRESHFELETGQFRDPETGRFEPGGAPPDYDPEADRFRAEDGQFKERADDLYDEWREAHFDDLSYEG